MQYDSSVYLLLHRTLYRFFGPPVGALVEVIAVLLSVVLAILARKHEDASFGIVFAAVCMIVTQAIWWVWVYPANLAMWRCR
jgi:hypothetical protein